MSESDTQRQTHRRELWYEWLNYKDMLASYEQCTGIPCPADCEAWLQVACDIADSLTRCNRTDDGWRMKNP